MRGKSSKLKLLPVWFSTMARSSRFDFYLQLWRSYKRVLRRLSRRGECCGRSSLVVIIEDQEVVVSSPLPDFPPTPPRLSPQRRYTLRRPSSSTARTLLLLQWSTPARITQPPSTSTATHQTERLKTKSRIGSFGRTPNHANQNRSLHSPLHLPRTRTGHLPRPRSHRSPRRHRRCLPLPLRRPRRAGDDPHETPSHPRPRGSGIRPVYRQWSQLRETGGCGDFEFCFVWEL